MRYNPNDDSFTGEAYNPGKLSRVSCAMKRALPSDPDLLYAQSLILNEREDLARQFEKAAAMYDRASRLYEQCVQQIERSRLGIFAAPEFLGSLPRSPWFPEPESAREMVGRKPKAVKPTDARSHPRRARWKGRASSSSQ